jgi:2-polyprenyl-6-methoxyphenol hydroxylase-like FAD-dependent oxidoreductase
MLNDKTGEVLQKIYPNGMIRVSRRRLRKLCSEGLDIQYGKVFVDVQISAADGSTVTAHFADGSANGSMLIGADGPRSQVREVLLGTEKAKATTLGHNFNLINVKFDDAKKARHVRSSLPRACLACHPDGICSFIAGSSLLTLPNIDFSDQSH